MLPSGGGVIAHGPTEETREENAGKYAFHVYETTGGELTHRTIRATCKHEGVELQPVSAHAFGHAQGKEILISCPGCKDIKVMDIETGLASIVFNRGELMPDLMCSGDTDTMFVSSLGDSFPLLELDLNTRPFTQRKVLTTGVTGWCSGMCYLPAPHNMLVLSIANQESHPSHFSGQR